jgi:hypothetical protein
MRSGKVTQLIPRGFDVPRRAGTVSTGYFLHEIFCFCVVEHVHHYKELRGIAPQSWHMMVGDVPRHELWGQDTVLPCPVEVVSIELLPNMFGKLGVEGISNDDELAIPDTLPYVG